MIEPMETTVVNIRDHPDWQAEGGVYIGRAVARRGLKASMFANKYIEGKDGDREMVIARYKYWFYREVEFKDGFKEAVEALRGKMLVCWCVPDDCHGRIIKEYLEGGSDGLFQ
jgi:hypothetical protein